MKFKMVLCLTLSLCTFASLSTEAKDMKSYRKDLEKKLKISVALNASETNDDCLLLQMKTLDDEAANWSSVDLSKLSSKLAGKSLVFKNSVTTQVYHGDLIQLERYKWDGSSAGDLEFTSPGTTSGYSPESTTLADSALGLVLTPQASLDDTTEYVFSVYKLDLVPRFATYAEFNSFYQQNPGLFKLEARYPHFGSQTGCGKMVTLEDLLN